MITIDLSGPQGNAFFLLGTAKRMCAQLALDPKPVLDKMQESDYDNLLSVFEENFGDYVELVR